MRKESRALDEAIGWHIRQLEPGFADWETFTAWLEADRAHSEAYAKLAARDQAVADRLAKAGIAQARNSDPTMSQPPVFRRRAAIAGIAAFAMSITAVTGIYLLSPKRDLYAVGTPPGVQHKIRLAGGSSLELNGSTIVRLDRENPRYAEVAQGEVTFVVKHDDARPFRVKVADAELHDIGTRFNVLREGSVTEVAVSEGAVRYEAGGQAVDLTPGRKLRAVDGDPVIQLTEVDPADIGTWSEGRLVYRNEPLAAVARDLSRILGRPVQVAPGLAARPVTAVIQVPADRAQLVPRLEKILDIKVRRNDEGWILTESH